LEAIVLFSHGSVLCGSERNLLELAARMRLRGDAPIVEAGFLNYSEPRFADAVARCAASGATRILIAPYFLIPGKFVVEDLPAAIAEVAARYPAIEFATADVIGFHPLIEEAIFTSADGARPPAVWLEALHDSKEWCRENPRCPLYASQYCRLGAEATT
jgi:sirohydrochlorin ferrochelatase